jgi:hypothetical protein
MAESARNIGRIVMVEVATDGSGWLYPKPAGLLAGLADAYQGNEYIRTRILSIPCGISFDVPVRKRRHEGS